MKQTVMSRLVVLCGSAAWITLAAAQPDPNAPGLKQNPGNQDAEAMVLQAQKEGMQQAMRMVKMTPQERLAEMQKMMEKVTRQTLTQAGFKDPALQDTILACIAAQEKSRDTVRRAAVKVWGPELGGGDKRDAAAIEAALDDYMAAVEDAKVERETLVADLDRKIGFSRNPRLKGWLLLTGVIGDAAWYTGGITMMGSMSLSSLAMFQQANAAPPPPAGKPAGGPIKGGAQPGAAQTGAAPPNAGVEDLPEVAVAGPAVTPAPVAK